MPNSDDPQSKRPARPFAPPFKGPASTGGASTPLKPRPTPSSGAPRFFTPRAPSPAAGATPVLPQAAESAPELPQHAPPETSEESLRRAAQNAAFAVDLAAADAAASFEVRDASVADSPEAEQEVRTDSYAPEAFDEPSAEQPSAVTAVETADQPQGDVHQQTTEADMPSWLEDSPAEADEPVAGQSHELPSSSESRPEVAAAEGAGGDAGWDELSSVSMGDLPVEPAPLNRDVFLTPAPGQTTPPAEVTPAAVAEQTTGAGAESWSPVGDSEPADDDEDPFGWGTTQAEQEVVAPGYSMGGSGGPGPALEPGQRGEELASLLENLAQKLRDGELKAPSVDPASGDAAALAAVLASLLGRSR